jgi:hypothetical protein
VQKPLSLFIGPELIWIVYYIAVLITIRMTGSPVKSMDNFWVNTAYIIPLIMLPLTFMLYYVDAVPHKWLLPRLIIAGILGTHFVLNRALLAHSEQGPGVGTAYMMGIIFMIVVLAIMSVWALIKF